MNDMRGKLRSLFDAAVGAADPAKNLAAHLPDPPKGRTIVVGAGKAAAAMAKALEDSWPGPLSGLVVTRYGHGLPCRRIEVVEASHPVPDSEGQKAAARILASVGGLTADDLVICLMSGGASALLALPAPGLSPDDKRAINRALLASGADIAEMNCVRKHLSAIKGGRLAAAAHPARIVTLAISDVPGDDLSVIGSGPTVADPTRFKDARAILEKYAIAEPKAALDHLRRGGDETPKPGDSRLARAEAKLIATPRLSLEAAARRAAELGYAPLILGDAIEGEAREAAKVIAGIAKSAAAHGHPLAAPAAILSGGETTVTVKSPGGKGGRNAEFLLALGLALGSHPKVWALAADTDGIDGSEDNAGAFLAPDSLERARAVGLDAARLLARNDSYSFFSGIGDLLMTGPTRTNVNDFRVLLIEAI